MSSDPMADMARRQTEEELKREPRKFTLQYNEEAGAWFIIEGDDQYAFDQGEEILVKELKGAASGNPKDTPSMLIVKRWMKEMHEERSGFCGAALVIPKDEIRKLYKQMVEENQ